MKQPRRDLTVDKLVNPEVTAKATRPESTKSYQTHVPEPRWQRTVSVVVVILLFLAWIWLANR